MKNCESCGALLGDTDERCPRCGFKNVSEKNKRSENSPAISLKKDDRTDGRNGITNKNINDNHLSGGGDIAEGRGGYVQNTPEYESEDLSKRNEYKAPVRYNPDGARGTDIQKSFDVLCLLGFILTFFGGGVISLILCIIGVIKFDESKSRGKGFGIAGIILNLIIIVASIIVGILFTILALTIRFD